MENHSMLFISPHLDDAVLSCGGYIGKLCGRGHAVKVLTVFSGSPQGRLSLLARALHTDWRLPADAPAVRREEDRKALAMLGAEADHAGFLDCIYRRDPLSGRFVYRRLKEILQQENPSEDELITDISETIVNTVHDVKADHLFSPLGLGGHVDHLTVRAAAEAAKAACRDTSFHFYEDLPYAIDDSPSERHFGGMRSYLCIREDGGEQKHLAMEAYTSQVKSPRYSGGIDIDAIIQYGLKLGKGAEVFAERMWTMGEVPFTG